MSTLFPSRAKAKAAIKRTIKNRYESYGLDFEQEFGKLRVKRVGVSYPCQPAAAQTMRGR